MLPRELMTRNNIELLTPEVALPVLQEKQVFKVLQRLAENENEAKAALGGTTVMKIEWKPCRPPLPYQGPLLLF